jgi:hypothetical protein
MNRRDRQPVNDTEPEASARLVDDLRALYGAHLSVPSDVDDRVLGMARRRFADRRPRILVLRWAGAAALAASVLLAVLLLFPIEEAAEIQPGQVAVAAREDLDGSGEVDILDAFALARYIQDDERERPEWDVNRDGVVDRGDVDVIAMSAVSLGRGVLQ